MKFTTALVSFALLAQQALAQDDAVPSFLRNRELQNCHDCSCFTCDPASVVDNGDGTVSITVTHCKDDSISWMCCTGVDGVEGTCGTNGPCTSICSAAAPCGDSGNGNEAKCNTIPQGGGLTVVVDKDATYFTINTHDGRTTGTADMQNSICGGNGNQGMSCGTGYSAHCLIDFNLAGDCGYVPPGNPGMIEDPHLKSWTGEWFDYMGECDLNLMHAPKFDGKWDMDIQVRTTMRYDFSFIEAAALRIGDDILEVGSFGDYALNGVEGALSNHHEVPMIGEYPVYYTMVNKKRHRFDVIIAENENVTISTFKDWVSVRIFHGDEERFGGVSGMMGTYYGEMLGRDGTSLHDDINALGQDWQVRPEEGSFFRADRAPQYPEKCRLPTSKQEVSRRLSEGLSEEAAEMACSHLSGAAIASCIHDVMATGDLEVATSGAF